MKTAILVDGGFYRRRAFTAYGDKSPAERASELVKYCKRHLHSHGENSELYRIFYYDCFPMARQIYHPLLKRTIDYSKSVMYSWSIDFFNELKKKRKLALRMGKLAEQQAHFELKPSVVSKLINGTKTLNDLTESDFILSVEQKGVDMKIGLDIASMAYKKQVDQIVLISGDSDFVPAAKLARREGIDFVLDALHTNIKPDLFEHIDALRTCDMCFRPRQARPEIQPEAQPETQPEAQPETQPETQP